MLKEIRKLRGKSKQKYLYFLMNSGKIPKHTNEKGYVCYDPEELKTFHNTHRRGRPSKTIKGE